MGPSIILDKSSLQALSADEINALKRFYQVTIAPVLVIEILADLRKKDTGERTPEQEVVHLAQKLSQMDSAVNLHYATLIRQSLSGHSVPMKRRPTVGHGKYVQAADGQIGVVFEETPEELAILRWQDALFSDAEQAVAERWRYSTKNIDLEAFKKEYKASDDFTSAKNLEELCTQVDAFLVQNDTSSDLLKMILLEFGFDQTLASQVFMLWEAMTHRSMQSFAPYALYCFKANLVFYLGLIRNFLGTRPTNRVDLEYVYYLPFCSAFSSKDKFHKQLVPLFLELDQVFISGEELKADLSRLNNSLSPENISGPPKNESSPTYQAWKSSSPHWEAGAKIQSSPPNRDKSTTITKRIDSLLQSPEITNPEILKNIDESKIDFMIRKRSMRLTDPCFCHSGKKFRDCHWTPEMK